MYETAYLLAENYAADVFYRNVAGGHKLMALALLAMEKKGKTFDATNVQISTNTDGGH